MCLNLLVYDSRNKCYRSREILAYQYFFSMEVGSGEYEISLLFFFSQVQLQQRPAYLRAIHQSSLHTFMTSRTNKLATIVLLKWCK